MTTFLKAAEVHLGLIQFGYRNKAYRPRLPILRTASLIAVTSAIGLLAILDAAVATVSVVFATFPVVDSTFVNICSMPGSARITVLFTVRKTSEVWSISGVILLSKDSSRLDNLIRAKVIAAIIEMLISEPAMYQMTKMLVAVVDRFIGCN